MGTTYSKGLWTNTSYRFGHRPHRQLFSQFTILPKTTFFEVHFMHINFCEHCEVLPYWENIFHMLSSDGSSSQYGASTYQVWKLATISPWHIIMPICKSQTHTHTHTGINVLSRMHNFLFHRIQKGLGCTMLVWPHPIIYNGMGLY